MHKHSTENTARRPATSICEARREASRETKPANTLVFDF